MYSKSKVATPVTENSRKRNFSEKMSFHLSMENINLNASCFGCEKSINTRPIHVCLDCCHKLKDLNEIQNEMLHFAESVEKNRENLHALKELIGNNLQNVTNRYLFFDIFKTDPKPTKYIPDYIPGSMNITNLNNDCMSYIFEYLELNDLLNIADSSKAFYVALYRVFKRKYNKTDLILGKDYYR